jgi:hypothetical protein
MEIVFHTLVVLHFVGIAALLGGFLYQMSATEKKVLPGQFHGVLTQLVTGIALVGIAESGALEDESVDHMKIGVKLLVALVVAGLIIVNRKKPSVPVGIWAAIGGLTLLNVVLAVFW